MMLWYIGNCNYEKVQPGEFGVKWFGVRWFLLQCLRHFGETLILNMKTSISGDVKALTSPEKSAYNSKTIIQSFAKS